jgi:glycosyltransferase involved in cell wall biosynthesis
LLQASPSAMSEISNSNSALNIAYGALSLDFGGLEKMILSLAKLNVEHGGQSSILCIERAGHLAEEAKKYGIRVISFEKPLGRNLAIVPNIQKKIQQLKPDVIHTHTIGALWYIGKATSKVDTAAIIHTEHIDNVIKATGNIAKLKTRLMWHQAAKFAARFSCVSPEVLESAARYRTVPRKKLTVITNGIDLSIVANARENRAELRQSKRQELGLPEDAILLGTVGRLNEVKRQELLIQATTRIPDVHLVLVGDGPERGKLEQITTELNLSNRVHFIGFQSQPESWLAAVDVFALSSRLEALPLALLEAMAAELPVVSTNVGGVAEVIQDGVSGYLVSNGDVEQLTCRIAELVADPVQRKQFGQVGRKIVEERYSLDRMYSEYQKLYQEVLADQIRK